jgi:3'(2'), 5'-bisphosphate nucleotidase/myo-inositol-1(or 4)-monophosphatase
MNLNLDKLQELTQLAIIAARAAGDIIDRHYQNKIQVHHKDRGTSVASQVVTEVDYKAQAAILEILEPSCVNNGLALLTEESPDTDQRLRKIAFWSIDPMDGTLAFINNTAGFSVSIALVARNGTPLIGVVYDPVTDNLMYAIRGRGVFKNGNILQIPALEYTQPLVLQTDFSFQQHPWFEQTQAGLQNIAQKQGLNDAEIQFAAGAVLTACKIIETPNTCYFKYPRTGNSGGSLWDYAATACLFHEAGAIATDIYGQAMELNRVDSTFMNHRGLLYAAYQALADDIMALYKTLSG